MSFEFGMGSRRPISNSCTPITNAQAWVRMASKSRRSARVGHTPFPAERGADAWRPVAAAHLRGALQADGERVPRAGGRVRDGLRRRVGDAGGGLYGEDSRARRALRGRTDVDPCRGLAPLQAEQRPDGKALLRR